MKEAGTSYAQHEKSSKVAFSSRGMWLFVYHGTNLGHRKG